MVSGWCLVFGENGIALEHTTHLLVSGISYPCRLNVCAGAWYKFFCLYILVKIDCQSIQICSGKAGACTDSIRVYCKNDDGVRVPRRGEERSGA